MKPRDTLSDDEELVYLWFNDLFTQGNLDVADEIIDPEIDYHGPETITPSEVSGPEGIKEYVEVYQQSFPDLWYTIQQTFHNGDHVGVRWTVSGTQESELFEMDYHGEEFSADGISVFTIRDGRISAVWSHWDTLKMVRELGIIPPVEAESGEVDGRPDLEASDER